MTTKKIQKPSTLLGSVIKSITGSPRYEGPNKVITQISCSDSFAYVETEKPLEDLHANGKKTVSWLKQDAEIDGYPVYILERRSS